MILCSRGIVMLSWVTRFQLGSNVQSVQVVMPVGTLANKRINYTNPYQQHRVFTLRSNQPWLVNFTPPKMELPPSATRPIGVILDGRRARPGTVDVLVFVNDEDDKSEECFKIRVRVH
jgi:nephrocystin-4